MIARCAAVPLTDFAVCHLRLKMWQLLLLLICFLNPVSSHFDNVSDHISLLAFKGSITRDPLNVLADWLPNITFCNWRGVRCNSKMQRVRSLNLTDVQLEGTISPSLGNLSFLSALCLSNNSLHGQIPPQLGRLYLLRNLALQSNRLEGSIPGSLAACHNLVGLSLAGNRLIGTIPAGLSALKNLRFLILGFNNLSGTIPPSFGNLSSLEVLQLASNNLQGHIPGELGLLARLKWLHCYENHLTGAIPSTLSNISSLTQLVLYMNNLVGVIPPELGKLTQLNVLLLWANQLSGSIPNSIANCSQLNNLQLDENGLSGAVPLELGKLSYLRVLGLSSNQLVSGSTTNLTIVTALANCSSLRRLSLHNNLLTGVLEQFPANLSWLSLKGNSITGSIPRQIGNLTGLTFLDLSSNLLTGRIPTELGSLNKLERLWLDNNKLDGSLPSEIGELKGLGLLSISMNMLSGRIPDTIGKLQELRDLILHSNRFSGSIPTSLGNCYVLEKLDLSNNLFKGSIPPEVAGLPNLQFYFNLSRNFLGGSLPFEISKMIHVQAIDISGNRLSGHIPATLESCVGLEYLNLSWNALQGPIPISLGNLKSLGDLDLSSNQLSGPIPTSLQDLPMLRGLNFSFNNLSGEVPKRGVFAELTAASFVENPSLCGQWITQMPACPLLAPKKHAHSLLVKRVIAPIIGASALVLCCLFVVFCRRPHLYKQNIHLPEAISLKLGFIRISYEDLVNATDQFSTANLLGVGSFGSVYKAKLSDGIMAAVKILKIQNRQAIKSFSTECRVLSRACHRNLVKIMTSCSHPKVKALVLEFMSNGNLEKWLYPDGDEESSPGLSFRDLLNISIDIGHGMEYLHHDCHVQVVHCDLKPSNVLLDDDMTAHVADFGIARLICEDSVNALSSSLALRGSIGYVAPEYGVEGGVSTKGDVYSYGIVLLEMVTRKKPTNDMFVGEMNLQSWVIAHFPNRVMEIVDCKLMNHMSEEGMDQEKMRNCVIPFIHVGLLCTKESPQARPTMREVVRALRGLRANLEGASGLPC